MPAPKKNEPKEKFIQRCMPILVDEGKEKDQAFAVCTAMFESQKDMNIKELTIDDYSGVDSIALVENPAIEVDFLYFNNDKKVNVCLAVADNEKRIITGPALIPEKMIYRYDKKTNEEFFVYFSSDTVLNISEKYMIEKRNAQVNIEHELPVEDICVVESWIVTDPKIDKAATLGYQVPKGTWMISLKVHNDGVWNNLIKEGIVKGFSIEGAFVEKFAAETETNDDRILKEILNILKIVED